MFSVSVEECLARIEGVLEQMGKRVSRLENEVSHLRNEISELRREIFEFRREFIGWIKWLLGIVIGMWISIMCTLIPILLKLLGLI